jgi:hypothetical protein
MFNVDTMNWFSWLIVTIGLGVGILYTILAGIMILRHVIMGRSCGHAIYSLCLGLLLFISGITSMVWCCYNNPLITNPNVLTNVAVQNDLKLILSVIEVFTCWILTIVSLRLWYTATIGIKCLCYMIFSIAIFVVGMYLFQDVFQNIYMKIF